MQGGAWLTGGLDALATETGWDPASAETIVGTSAGSMLAALLAGGVPPWFMVAHSAGESFEAITDASRAPCRRRRPHRRRRLQARPVAAADRARLVGLALRSLTQPHRFTPSTVVSGWLPRGIVSTDPLRDQVRRVVPSGWAPHPGLWIVACDYATGVRVPFGREGSPPAELADAVAASCAIPGFYRPVEIAGRRYVDGGMYSTSNLDLLRAESLDLVICLNPTSSLHPIRAVDPREWSTLVFRSAAGRRLGSEAKKLRSAGTPVVLVQPLERDLQTMSRNLMSTRNRNQVIEVARRTVAEQLREPGAAELLSRLPAGRPEKVTRPDVPTSQWPSLDELQPRPAT